ncbi:hypothetical protein SLS61_003405 [Didymella pomorum]
MDPDADAIAECVLEAFAQLPDKRKPRLRTDGSREWVPLSGIVLAKGEDPTNLPQADGNILHDWHAEVVAIRTFNRFLLDECERVSSSSSDSHSHSAFVHRRSNLEQSDQQPQPFTIREDVQIHMYCSEAPCGDASMELTMDAQEDATPWTSAPPTISSEPGSDGVGALRGRSNFSLLGAVRCKPSRPDAPPTLSKSCTDKLALKQATSLLSSVTSAIISPKNAYIHLLVLPASQYVPTACERAFSRSGRLRGLTDETIQGWRGGYNWQSFTVKPTQREFQWSRRSIAASEKAVPSNLSAVFTPSWQETLIGGVLQGRKQMDPRGASKISRKNMWMLAAQIARIASAPAVLEALTQALYQDVKTHETLAARRKVKLDMQNHGLTGWVHNTGDSNFTLPSPST